MFPAEALHAPVAVRGAAISAAVLVTSLTIVVSTTIVAVTLVALVTHDHKACAVVLFLALCAERNSIIGQKGGNFSSASP